MINKNDKAGLEQLLSNEFVFRFAAAATPAAVTELIRSSPEFRVLQERVKETNFDPEQLRAFVNRLLLQFEPGKQCHFEPALSAIAVLLEDKPADFATEHLEDLASLQAAELAMAIRVAQQCLMRRSHRLEFEEPQGRSDYSEAHKSTKSLD